MGKFPDSLPEFSTRFRGGAGLAEERARGRRALAL